MKRELLVIPSIDIKDGKTVRVVQGIPELNCPEYGDDPIKTALLWRAENAKMLHVVDFDGAFQHSNKNLSLIEKMCESVVIPIEYSGGIRSLEEADTLFNLGVCRLALATLPISDPAEFYKIFEKFGPSKIIVCLDVIDDQVMIRGRKIKSGISPQVMAAKMRDLGVNRIIVTDVKRNGMLMGPNIGLSNRIAEETDIRITLSGGIRNKDELMDIKNVGAKNIDSVIIGRALYENRFPCQKLWRLAETNMLN